MTPPSYEAATAYPTRYKIDDTAQPPPYSSLGGTSCMAFGSDQNSPISTVIDDEEDNQMNYGSGYMDTSSIPCTPKACLFILYCLVNCVIGL